MSEPVTFYSESSPTNTSYYDVHENGMVYRPQSDEKISFIWSNVQQIEDRPNGRVVILLNNLKEIPIRYSANDFPVFLKTICLKIADIRKEDFRFQNFRLTAKYLFQLRFAVTLLILSLIVSYPVSEMLFFLLLTLSIPLGIFLKRQPVSVTLDEHSMVFHFLHKNETVYYHDIVDVNFKIVTNDYGNTLGVLFKRNGKNDLTINKLEDIIIFFIMVQIQIDRNVVA